MKQNKNKKLHLDRNFNPISAGDGGLVEVDLLLPLVTKIIVPCQCISSVQYQCKETQNQLAFIGGKQEKNSLRQVK